MVTHPFTSVLIAVSFVAGLVGGVALLPKRNDPFLTVHDITQDEAGIVTPDRTINYDPGFADWTVAVVGSDMDAPSCKTVPGPEMHQGWSPYVPGQEVAPMSLDVWVGDPGCWDRLSAGEYTESTTWTPRDGGPVVVYRRTFVKP